MKVLITSPSLNPNQNVSGISSITQFIISSNKENFYTHFKVGREDDEKHNLEWVFSHIRLYLRWFYLMVTQKQALIHFNMALSKNSIIRDSPLIFISRLFRKRMIIHIHGGDFLMFKKNPLWMKSILNKVFSGKNPIIVLSSLEKNILEQRFNIKRIYVLPNCTGLKEATEFDRFFPEKDILSVLFLGRISADKGIEYIFQAFEILKKKGNKLKFFMAGKGPEEKAFIQRFYDLLGADFEFKGVVSGDQKTELFKKCNVFLLPSFYEGLPMALIESMSFGLVPVITNVGSIKSVIENGKNGIFVSTHSSEEIVAAIEKLLKDKECLALLSKNARQFIFRNFNPDIYIDRLNEIYGYE
jgi:glycosyltransferase involved in cell wall biosynthesis